VDRNEVVSVEESQRNSIVSIEHAGNHQAGKARKAPN